MEGTIEWREQATTLTGADLGTQSLRVGASITWVLSMGGCWEEGDLNLSRKEVQVREQKRRGWRRLIMTMTTDHDHDQQCWDHSARTQIQVPYCGQLDLLTLWPACPEQRAPLTMTSAPAVVLSTMLAQAEPT